MERRGQKLDSHPRVIVIPNGRQSLCRLGETTWFFYSNYIVLAVYLLYKKAVWWFEKTLAHIPSSLSEMWEPTVVNLAHALRKLKKYREAITYYEKALALSTRSLSTYAGLAYTYHLQDNFSAAITYYHKALWLRPDDQFCTEMLTLALVDECRHGLEPKTESHQTDLFIQ
ncbi:Cell division cycle protein 16 [Sarracenia purpurea var. burkii]